jgi:hypothetical protein
MAALLAANTLIGEVILIALIGLVLLFIFKIGKTLLKLLFGIIINSVLGIIAIFALNQFFGMAIPVAAYTLIPTALFGLPAVGTFVILRFYGLLAVII